MNILFAVKKFFLLLFNLHVCLNFINSIVGVKQEIHHTNDILAKEKKSKNVLSFYKLSVQIVSLFIIVLIACIYMFNHQNSVLLSIIILCIMYLLLNIDYIAEIYTKPSLNKRYELDQTNVFGMLMFSIAYFINDDFWIEIIIFHDLFTINSIFIINVICDLLYWHEKNKVADISDNEEKERIKDDFNEKLLAAIAKMTPKKFEAFFKSIVKPHGCLISEKGVKISNDGGLTTMDIIPMPTIFVQPELFLCVGGIM